MAKVAGNSTLVLGYNEVSSLLDVPTVLEQQRHVFLNLADERATISPNLWLRPPLKSRGWLKILAGYDPGSGALGSKIVARFPEGPPGSNLGAFIVLFDDDTGFPVAIGHGAADPVIGVQWGRQARERLEAAGADVTYEEHRGGHAIDPRFLRRLPAWVAGALASAGGVT